MNEEKRCEIHGSRLHNERVPICLGLPVRDETLFEARRTLFPNSRMNIQVCVSDDDYRELPVCLKCREAETKWRKENGRELMTRGFKELFES
jgi:hypothetical protein